MTSAAMKVRLHAAATKAALPGESAHPEIIERSGGTATITVIFKRGHHSTEDISHHGSWYTDAEKEKLLNATLKSLDLRGKRSATR
jgi:hypothetical protein